MKSCLRVATLTMLALLVLAAPSFALKVTTWNLLQYPATNLAARQPHFRTVMAAMDPDIVIAQELNTAAGKDSFLLNVLNVVQPGQWTGAWLQLGGEGGAFFWKSAKVNIVNISSITTGGPRPVMIGLVKPVRYAKNPGWFRLYSIHLKAGNPSSTPADSATRHLECSTLRTNMNNQVTTVVGTNFLIGGDSNFYGSWESGYIRLTESQANNNGRCIDPLNMPGTWNSSGYRDHHTQCPCLSGCGPGFSGGGMDDRFDWWMSSSSLRDGSGLEMLTSTYRAYGNDGQHYNQDINAGGINFAVPIGVANALRDAADHIPVVVELKLPAKILVPSQLAFGDVIVGATPTSPLSVAHGGYAPADTVTYSFAAPAGFSAPGGSLTAAAGAAAINRLIGMSTASAGVKNDTLVVNSNDVDTTAKKVLLSGRVLAHAAPSLDSAAVVTAGTLDLGEHEAGSFGDLPVRVHNQGYATLQARLAVTTAAISGGAGRFSLAGGFTPALLGATGQSWPVHFDDAGATTDSTYTATLSFTTEDEALPGFVAGATLTISLSARVLSGSAGVGDGPNALRFLPPRPNPVHDGTDLAFDLPREQFVDLALYDLVGRRIESLISGNLGAGHHNLRWIPRNSTGMRLSAGLYFIRFHTEGLSRVSRLIVLP